MQHTNNDQIDAAIIDSADKVLASYRDAFLKLQTLFHYTSLDAAVKILETRKAWCSNFRYSNDPSEAAYGRQLLDDVLTNDPDLKLQGARTAIGGLDPYGISLSVDGDALPQWRAYCRNGRGAAVGLGFDILRMRKSMTLVRVLYAEKEQRQFIIDILNVFRAPLLAASNNSTLLGELVEKLARYLAIARSALKSPAYESEHEYRLLDLLPRRLDSPHPGLLFRTNGGLLVPYLVADLTESSAPNANEPITSIQVGPCLDYELVEAALELYRDQNVRQFAVTQSAVRMRCDGN